MSAPCFREELEAIAEEFNIEYFLREGVVRWIINQDSAAYPCRMPAGIRY